VQRSSRVTWKIKDTLCLGRIDLLCVDLPTCHINPLIQEGVEASIRMATNSTQFEGGSPPSVDELGVFIESTIESNTSKEPAADERTEIAYPSQTDDPVNRFLLCVFASRSAKRIKAHAQTMGESLSVTGIVRAFLRTYRLAAGDGRRHSPCGLTLADLRGLSDNVLRDELARHSNDRVQTSETRLARAVRLRDEPKIELERKGLETAIKIRDRLAQQGFELPDTPTHQDDQAN
jgi:hypothetical protein